MYSYDCYQKRFQNALRCALRGLLYWGKDYIDLSDDLVPGCVKPLPQLMMKTIQGARWRLWDHGSICGGTQCVNTLRPRQNGRHFPDDIFKCILLNENVWIPIQISLEFVPKGPINNIPSLVQIMAWRRSGDKPLSEPMMVSFFTHICVTRPQWVNETKVRNYLRFLSGIWYSLI